MPTDGRTDMTKVRGDFREYAYARKTNSQNILRPLCKVWNLNQWRLFN